MLPQRESLPAVTAAGVVAVIFSCFGILGCGLVLLALLAMPLLPSDAKMPPMHDATRGIAAVIYVFLLAICLGQLFVAINVFRRRNWARVTMVIWASLMVVMTGFGMIAILFITGIASQATPQEPNSVAFLSVLRLFLFVFYGIPLGVGVWWLILFTRPRVAAAFQSSARIGQIPFTMDASGFPAPVVSLPPSAPKKPCIPLPIAVIAAFDLSGAAWMILAVFIPLPFQAPFFLFGVQIPQIPYKAFLAALGIAYVAFVVGIFKLRRWGLDSLLIVKSLFVISGVVTLLNPKFMAAMDDMMVQISAKSVAMPAGQLLFPHRFMEAILAFSYIFAIALLVTMAIYRSRFLKASAEAAG